METITEPRATNVGDADFDSEVLQSDVPVLVDFWAEWCGPCKIIGPTVEELAGDYEGRLKVAKVNIDDNPESAMRFGVRSIPTLILFKNGEATETAIGVRPKGQLTELVERHIA